MRNPEFDYVVHELPLATRRPRPDMTANGAAAPEGRRQSKWNQKLTVVWPVWSSPLITDRNVRFAWLVSANRDG
jgi:hypothetical protein